MRIIKINRTKLENNRRRKGTHHFKNTKKSERNREKGKLYRTIDEVQSWQMIESNYPDLHRIRLTDNKIWIVGKKGTILVKSR